MKRNIPETSLLAYHDEGNAENRSSHRQIIIDFFTQKAKDTFTIREVSTATGLTYAQTQKRITDLSTGPNPVLAMVGKKVERGNYCGTFQIIEGQQLLFPRKPKTKFELLCDTVREKLTQEKAQEVITSFNKRWNQRRKEVAAS